MVSAQNALLTANDPPPVLVHNPRGGSPFLFLGDHAGNAVPAQLQMLGLSEADLRRHIAWDIGIRSLGRQLADSLDATFIHQHYSRLVIDCNRAPSAPDAIPETSDGTLIPGNRGLDANARTARAIAIHDPYQTAISDHLDERARLARQTILIALHSFTPRLGSDVRPWHAGILHDGGNVRFALQLLSCLRQHRDLRIGENQPYVMDSTDFTVPTHAYPRSVPYAEVEIRQDQLADEGGIDRWHRVLGEAFKESATIWL
jgi:predicted N-formylglutamate amidohydrolase